MPLTDAKIRNTEPGPKPIKLTDGGGLCLLVKPTGKKLWRYRYRIEGRESTYAIGAYPETGLSDARSDRDAARKLVKKGVNLAQQRKTERMRRSVEHANTFKAVAIEWIEKRCDGWSDYYHSQVKRGLKANVYPSVGAMPIKDVTAAHLLEILQRVEGRGAETMALLIRQWCSAIFRYAVATLRADSDPAAVLRGAVTRPKVEHSKPLSRDEIPDLLEKLDGYSGYGGRFKAHGFRATASTILNELGYRPVIIDRQLAHKERNKVRASYNQAEYLEDRIQMMQAWADLIDTLQDGDGKVVRGQFGKAV